MLFVTGNILDDVDSVGGSGDECEHRSSEKKSGSTKLVKKRKHESIMQTNCKSKMMVNLIENKW